MMHKPFSLLQNTLAAVAFGLDGVVQGRGWVVLNAVVQGHEHARRGSFGEVIQLIPAIMGLNQDSPQVHPL